MAVIQYTGLVSGVQGKINGSVLSRGRAGNVIYASPRQRREPTASQLGIRGTFSAIASFWRDLTPEERADWAEIADSNPLPDRFGEPRIISGYAYFQRMLSFASPLHLPVALIADLAADSVYEFEVDTASADWELTDSGYLLTNVTCSAITLNDSPVENQWNLYISLPVPDFGLPYFDTWYLIGQGVFAANLGFTAALNFDVDSALMSNGFRTFEDAKHLFKGISFIPSQGGVSVEQIWNVEMSGEPVVIFPVFADLGTGSIAWDGSSGGIFDYFWGTSEKAAILADFTAETAFATPQLGTGPIVEENWLSPYSTDFLSSGGPSTLIPDKPISFSSWYFAWYDQINTLWSYANGFVAPTRMRLVDIGTGEKGPWVVGYWPIMGI